MRKAAVLFTVIMFVFVAINVNAEKDLKMRCEVVANIGGEIMIRRQNSVPKHETKEWIREVFKDSPKEAREYWVSAVDKAYLVDVGYSRSEKKQIIENFKSGIFKSCMNTLE